MANSNGNRSYALTPRFSDADRVSLRRDQGLTNEQVMWLERDLGVVLDDLGPHVPMNDVRGELQGLAKEVAAACTRVERWKAAIRPSHLAEASGRLAIASATLQAEDRPTDGTWPDLIRAADLILLLGRVTKKAVSDAPSAQRELSSASPRAIETIIERLKRPTDPASAQAFAALKIISVDNRKRPVPSLRGVADIVFAAAYRALYGYQGRPGAKAPTSAHSIRTYLESLPTSQRRRRGRPPSRKASTD